MGIDLFWPALAFVAGLVLLAYVVVVPLTAIRLRSNQRKAPWWAWPLAMGVGFAGSLPIMSGLERSLSSPVLKLLAWMLVAGGLCIATLVLCSSSTVTTGDVREEEQDLGSTDRNFP